MKGRYTLYYESDYTLHGHNIHTWGNANSLKTAKGYISRCRRELADEHPRNFFIRDWLETDENGFAKIVYEEA